MGVTPLQVACSKSFPAIVKYLIDQGANVNTRDNVSIFLFVQLYV